MYQTIVASDLHLSDAEPFDVKRPLWKLYKRRELFFDDDFVRCLEFVESDYEGPTELVLNGDIFDFDNITQLPNDRDSEINWLARLRGLGTEAWMSEFKMECIVKDHRAWFEALGQFVARGNRIIFITGNHDLELAWPEVQRTIVDAMGVKQSDGVIFCCWFYLSEKDTYISHGHQYDTYCSISDPMHPLIERRGKPHVRLPFGEIAERYLLNGMGYFNPHATSNFIMGLGDYLRFFFRYMLRTQPFLIWSWFWGSLMTLWVTFRHFLRPNLTDPLTVEQRTLETAVLSNATPEMVRQLLAANASSACTNPIRIVRELWLDRGLLLLGIVFVGFQFMTTLNLVWDISLWWALGPIFLFAPIFFVYSYSVNSTVFNQPLLTEPLAKLIFDITGTKRVVFGHSHEPESAYIGQTHYLNCGFWSPAYKEPECINRIGQPTFVLIRPTSDGLGREAELLVWASGAQSPTSFVADSS